MSNLPNRSNYGFLSCLFSLLKAKFSIQIKDFDLNYLKFDDKKEKNTINYCTGARSITNPLQKKVLNREKFCPFVKDVSAPHVCNLTYSLQSDSQKSKAAGSAALLLSILDLIKINYSSSGRIQSLNWSKNSLMISKYNWGEKKLGAYFNQKILNFGPVIGFINNLQFLTKKKDTFNRDQVKDFFGFPSLDEEMKGKEICSKKTCPNLNNTFLFPTGTTTSDAKTRTMKTFFFLTASTGIILPLELKNKISTPIDQFPFLIDNWYFNDWKNVNTYPSNWFLNKKRLNSYLKNNSFQIKKTLTYENFLQKSSHRNLTNKCSYCKKNLINLFYNSKGSIIKNRRYLLLRCLELSHGLNKKFDLKQLFELTKNKSFFSISKKNHFQSLISDLKFVSLCGSSYEKKNNLIKSLAKIDQSLLGDVPKNIERETKKVLETLL